MCEALDDHEGCASIAGQFIKDFHFADYMYIVVNADEEEEDDVLVDCLDTTTTTSRNGRELTLGRQKSGKGGKLLYQRHLWCSNDCHG